MIELKVVKAFGDHHIAQSMNYLRATGMRFLLLINFGRPRIEIRRVAAKN
jgi:GxxExxY protein